MKKKLLLLAFFIIGLTLPSYGQCNLNLTNDLPEIDAQCSVAFSDLTIPVITDSCGNTITPTTDTGIFPVTFQGTTTITWSYLDMQGNTDSQTQDIKINDFTEPVPDLAVLSDITSECELLEANVTVPTATDNCLGAVTVTNDATFPITSLGTTTITWTYTDTNGNATSQTQDVIIYDFTDPVPDTASLPDIHAQCEVLEADVPVPTATDNCSGTVVVTNNAVFPITAQGTTTITWTYTDASGNAASQLQDVIISDTAAPTPDTAVLSDIISECQLLEADVTVPTATDNCSGGVTVTSDAVFPITTPTTITWTYTDAHGNATTQTQDVILFDFTDPVPDTAILADIDSQCQVLQSDVPVPTATDNCSGTVIVTSDAVFPITSSTTITWTYTDASGNAATQLQDITIFDFTAPTADAPVLTDIIAECQLLQSDVAVPTATDNCSGVVTVTNDAVFPITNSGTITWTYTDAGGNSSTQIQDVIIFDFTDPTPDAAILADIVSPCEVLQTDVAVPTATDNCSGTVTVTNNAVFPITASTTIVWTFTDAHGNSGTQTQNVIINDAIPPVADIAVLADVIAQCELLALPAPTATDNCSGVITISNNAVFPITASTTVTWTYADASGNTTTQTQNVVINDTTGPIPNVALLADLTAQCQLLAADVTAPTATDNCSATVVVTSDAVFPITASTVITWTYEDGNSNTTTQTQNVVINDTTGPVPNVAVLSDITAQCEVLASDVTAPTATDNCSASVVVTTDAVFPITASTIITWTYEDGNSNTTTQTQNVVINDTTLPTVTLTDLTVSVDVNGTVTITPTQLTAGSEADNCGIASVTLSQDTFTCQELGAHLVTVTVTDVHGNSTSAIATVTITDPVDFCGALGVSQNDAPTFNLYPNPTNANVYIEQGQNEAIYSISVYSMSGQLVFHDVYKETAGHYTVSLENFAPGLYLFKLETSSGLFTKRIIKQ